MVSNINSNHFSKQNINKFCPKCSILYENEDDLFCEICRRFLENLDNSSFTKICSNCKTLYLQEDNFCENCRTKLIDLVSYYNNYNNYNNLNLENLFFPLLYNYNMVKLHSFENSHKIKNYYALYEFIAILNVSILFSALPKRKYSENNRIFSLFDKKSNLAFGDWIGLYRELGKIYNKDNFDLILGIDFYRKINNNNFHKIIDEIVQIRNTNSHGGSCQSEEENLTLKKIEKYDSRLISMLKVYLDFKFIYVHEKVKCKELTLNEEKNCYLVTIFNRNNPTFPVIKEIIYTTEYLEDEQLYIYDDNNDKALKLKKNIIRFEFCEICSRNSIFVFDKNVGNKKNKRASYKSFQDEKHPFEDESLTLKDIFKY